MKARPDSFQKVFAATLALAVVVGMLLPYPLNVFQVALCACRLGMKLERYWIKD